MSPTGFSPPFSLSLPFWFDSLPLQAGNALEERVAKVEKMVGVMMLFFCLFYKYCL